jgi:putative DNA-invertase from lambdoid prophage Rac
MSENGRFWASVTTLPERGVDGVSGTPDDPGTLFGHGVAMSRVFAYCRVSREDQAPDNQAREIAAAGFAVNTRRVVREHVSGSQAAMQRPEFARLVDRLEPGDVLVVTKLDRLGRSAADVRSTVEALAASGVRVHCLALGGADLTSAAGRLTMQVLAAVAEFELDLIRERTRAGLQRARGEGKRLGRPLALDSKARTRCTVALWPAGSPPGCPSRPSPASSGWAGLPCSACAPDRPVSLHPQPRRAGTL